MSNLRNSARLMGHLGSDPEIKVLGDKKKVANVALATHDTFKNDKGEKVDETQWHNLVIWDKLAELAEKYLLKGSEVMVEGKLVTRSYVDKDKVKRYVTEIWVSELLFMGPKKAAANS